MIYTHVIRGFDSRAPSLPPQTGKRRTAGATSPLRERGKISRLVAPAVLQDGRDHGRNRSSGLLSPRPALPHDSDLNIRQSAVRVPTPNSQRLTPPTLRATAPLRETLASPQHCPTLNAQRLTPPTLRATAPPRETLACPSPIASFFQIQKLDTRRQTFETSGPYESNHPPHPTLG
jgi:hypothetical protein